MISIASPSPARRQAVLLIHGIGDQRPMESLGSFVSQATGKRPGEADGCWFRPDIRSPNFDLFQIVSYDQTLRTDFYELYWAHLMENTRFGSVWRWFWTDLINRDMADMPPAMQEAAIGAALALALVLSLYTAAAITILSAVLLAWPAYAMAAFVAAALVAGAAAVGAVRSKGRFLITTLLASSYAFAFGAVVWNWVVALPSWAVPAALVIVLGLTAAIAFLDRRMISPVIGDAARYLRDTPDNIAARQAIRALGVDALERLHAAERGYDRIIVVGHSLGSIIGYDILRYAFARRTRTMKLASIPPEVRDFDEASGDPRSPDYWTAKRELCAAVGALPDGNGDATWLVTDFVTLGSPLAYANILLAGTDQDFRRRKEGRLSPTDPPHRSRAQNEIGTRGFYGWQDRSSGAKWLTPHHAAVFAFTRWTNLFFPARRVIEGDVIGGPVGGEALLGEGVRDVPIRTRHLFGKGFFSHTSYWRPGGELGTPSHIQALRLALNLQDVRSPLDLPRQA
jgi:hypothetical protein